MHAFTGSQPLRCRAAQQSRIPVRPTPQPHVAAPGRPQRAPSLCRMRAAPELDAEEESWAMTEEEELADDSAALDAHDGDATRAGAASILVDARGMQVAPKAAEVQRALADMSSLAQSELEVLGRAQSLLLKLGVRGVSLTPPTTAEVPELDAEEEEEKDDEDASLGI